MSNSIPTRTFSLGRIVSNMSRISALALAVLAFTLILPGSPAHASAANPDARVVRVERICGNDYTQYEFHLRNLGHRGRDVRGRVQWHKDGFNIGETFSLHVRAGKIAVQRERLALGEHAAITLRSQGQVIMRATMLGGRDCRKPNPL